LGLVLISQAKHHQEYPKATAQKIQEKSFFSWHKIERGRPRGSQHPKRQDD
jgi:hypothetical protein